MSDVDNSPAALYAPEPGWPRLPAGLTLGAVPAVAVDQRRRVFVVHRGTPPVLCFDPAGNFLWGWGDEHIKPGCGHAVGVDAQNCIWLTDIGHHQVYKFTPEGRLLMALGQPDRAGDGADQFNQPTDVVISPAGDIYVADGYGNARIVQFASDGTFIRQWGRRGVGEGEFDTPHALCMDSSGRLYVSDRGNSRVQVFDTAGRFLAQWRGLPYIDGLCCAADDTIYAVTGRDNGLLRIDPSRFEPGLPTDSPTSGFPIILESWGGPYCTYAGIVGGFVPPPGQFNVAHGIGVDHNGDVYVGEVRARRVQKLARRSPWP